MLFVCFLLSLDIWLPPTSIVRILSNLLTSHNSKVMATFMRTKGLQLYTFCAVCKQFEPLKTITDCGHGGRPNFRIEHLVNSASKWNVMSEVCCLLLVTGIQYIQYAFSLKLSGVFKGIWSRFPELTGILDPYLQTGRIRILERGRGLFRIQSEYLM